MAPPRNLGELGVATAGEAVAFGLGFALARVLEPEGVGLAQSAWAASGSQIRAVDPVIAATVAAEDVESLAWAKREAAKHGISGDNLEAIYGEILNAPGVPQLLTMLRRGTINADEFLHGLRKAKLETRWDRPVEELQHERLDPAVLATAVQRGVLDDPGLLPVPAPTAAGKVPPMPRADIDVLEEAKAGGFSRERLATITRIVGLPPAPGELLQLLNRGEIETVDFYRGVSEGNTRNEWGPSLIKLRRRLLTPHEYAELRLRGWIDDAAMHSGAALSGLNKDDTDLLAKVLGRPLSFHQVFIGLRRGGAFGVGNEGINPAFLKSLQESNIRPEWYQLAWAQRFTYPSAFVLRRLAEDGALTTKQLETVFLYQGWEPGFAKSVAEHYTRKTAASTDPHVGKAETQLWTALHKSYIQEEADDSVAHDHMTAIGVTEQAQPHVLSLWQRERSLTRKQLTPSQVKKAYAGAKMTLEEAVARLEQQGYTAADANTYLTE